MSVKTLSDCAKCPVVSYCDAHITGGTWPHAKGIDPCKVRIQDKGVDRV